MVSNAHSTVAQYTELDVECDRSSTAGNLVECKSHLPRRSSPSPSPPGGAVNSRPTALARRSAYAVAKLSSPELGKKLVPGGRIPLFLEIGLP